MNQELKIEVGVMKGEAVKCPRCQRYHHVRENYDDLCDRCCDVMISDWPDHPATAEIKKALQIQREKYGRKTWNG